MTRGVCLMRDGRRRAGSFVAGIDAACPSTKRSVAAVEWRPKDTRAE